LNFRAIGAAAVALVTAAALIFASPLGGLVHDRFTSKRSSNETRLSVYNETLQQVKQSPYIGFGSPRASNADPNLPHVGTQGQLFTVAYSYGVPALIFFVAWFLYTFMRSLRRGGPGRFWANIAILMLLVELPYYNYMPTPLHVVMIAAALAWRDILQPAAEEADA
jgi:O-antigen ligase